MDPEIKKKWIEALRSGRYTQAKGRLRRGDAFCCLGVLHDCDGGEWDPLGYVTRPAGRPDGWRLYDGDSRGLDGEAQDTLVRMNDDADASFDEIADWIEANL